MASPSPFLAAAAAAAAQPVAYYVPSQYDAGVQMEQQRLGQSLSDLAAGRPARGIVPINQLQRRVLESDVYVRDERARRARFPSANPLSDGPGAFAIGDLQLIPLRRVAVATPESTAASAAVAAISPIAGIEAMSDATLLQAGPRLAPVAVVRFGNVGPTQFLQQDAPKLRLSKTWDDYFAGIIAWYTAMIGVTDVPTRLDPTCRGYDVNEDSIGVTEAMLECLLLWLTESGRSNIKRIFPTPALHTECMSLPLRLTLYSDVAIVEGQPQMLQGYLSPFSWRHSPERKLAGEQVDAQTEALRAGYQKFLARLYSVMWRALMRRRLLRVDMPNVDFYQFLETALVQAAPQLMTVRVLEARILAIAARFQTAGEFFNTGQFVEDAVKFRTILEPQLGNLIGKYASFNLI